MTAFSTQPTDKNLNLGWADTWLPEGRWTDIFTGRIYQGGQWVRLHRDLYSIPVLAKEGAIVPMYRNDHTNDLSLDQPLEIHIWRGNNHYELYEDDGNTMRYRDGAYAITTFTLEERDNTLKLTITPPEDSHGLLPENRQMVLRFRDLQQEDITVTLGNTPVVVELQDIIPLCNPDRKELEITLLTRTQGSNQQKSLFQKTGYPPYLRSALAELDALWRE